MKPQFKNPRCCLMRASAAARFAAALVPECRPRENRALSLFFQGLESSSQS